MLWNIIYLFLKNLSQKITKDRKVFDELKYLSKCSNQYLNPLLKVEDLINPVDLSWNLDLLKVYIHQDDVDIIKSLAISRNPKPDSYGWHFTDHGRYMVKSGYQMDKLFLDMGFQDRVLGTYIKPLLAHSWKLHCSPKLKHFV